MVTRSAYVKMGWGASVVGVVMIVLYAILKVAEAQIGNLELLLGVGIVLLIAGIVGGVTVTRTDPTR